MCIYTQFKNKCKHSECSLISKIMRSNADVFEN